VRDIGMAEFRQRASLRVQAFARGCGECAGRQYFDGNITVQLLICAIDDTHAAGTDALNDSIMPDALTNLRHGTGHVSNVRPL